ncbi:MAG: hypothetical protein HRT44_13310 [Bdellovibrionales bacterium]|nr:hypothetical protein [Bdellovibrionales bacterium]
MKFVIFMSLTFGFLSSSFAEPANIRISGVFPGNLSLCESFNDFEELLKDPSLDETSYEFIEKQYSNYATKYGFEASLIVDSPSTVNVKLEQTNSNIGEETVTTISYQPIGFFGACIDHNEETGEIIHKCDGTGTIELEANLAGICPYFERYDYDESKLDQAVEDLVQDTIK